jgi:tRNA pseudouridine55 synthase
MDGILPVYKPVGLTSFDVIRAFKRGNHPTYKVGHGGTLDPFAEGVLLLLLGKATKQMCQLTDLPKTYRATAILGFSTTTLDSTGVVTLNQNVMLPSHELIYSTASEFIGTYEQEIPAYSAAKVNGKPRYVLARKGIVPSTKTKPVTIHKLTIESVVNSQVTFVAQVSSGTYVRQLSYDIFKRLNIESYLETLTRTMIGDFTIQDCVQVVDLASPTWQDKLLPRQ